MEISNEYFAEVSNKVATLREEVRTLTAKLTALETACLPIKEQLAFVFETDADDKPLKLTMTAKECRTLAALLGETK